MQNSTDDWFHVSSVFSGHFQEMQSIIIIICILTLCILLQYNQNFTAQEIGEKKKQHSW